MKKHMNATPTCNVYLWVIPFTQSWGCLICRHWRGGHGHYEFDHLGLETL